MAFLCLWPCALISELRATLLNEVFLNKKLFESPFNYERGSRHITGLKDTWVLVLLSTLGRFFNFSKYLDYDLDIGLVQFKHVIIK